MALTLCLAAATASALPTDGSSPVSPAPPRALGAWPPPDTLPGGDVVAEIGRRLGIGTPPIGDEADVGRALPPLAEDTLVTPVAEHVSELGLDTESAPLRDDTSFPTDPHQLAELLPPAPMAEPRPLFRFRWPTDGEITTYFDEVGPLSPRGHAGVDIANVWGTPVRAAEEGRVMVAVAHQRGYGWHVVIDHGHGLTTLYGHLSDFDVEEGQWVAHGQVIGWVGSTGYSTGPHLHFEVRHDDRHADPLAYLH